MNSAGGGWDGKTESVGGNCANTLNSYIILSNEKIAIKLYSNSFIMELNYCCF